VKGLIHMFERTYSYVSWDSFVCGKGRESAREREGMGCACVCVRVKGLIHMCHVTHMNKSFHSYVEKVAKERHYLEPNLHLG